MVNIGIIGMGGISGCHTTVYATMSDRIRIVACCDKIPERAQGKAAEIAINISEGHARDFAATAYLDYRELLADPNVHAVDICLPTDLHAEVAVAALRAGKDVLSEKPMALSVADCDMMVAAANETGRVLMVAHCIRFWPEYVALKALVDSGEYGAVRHAHFTRISAAPLWSSENWMMDAKRSGGVMLDMHIHDVDYIRFLLGNPQAVRVRGYEKNGMNAYAMVDYQYADDKVVSAESGWDYPGAFPFRMTFRVVLEKATIEWDYARGAMMVYPAEGEPFTPELLTGDGYHREIAYFLDCIENGSKPTIITPFETRESIRLVCLEIAALQSGELLAF